jgi:hypothetical protein
MSLFFKRIQAGSKLASLFAFLFRDQEAGDEDDWSV